MRKAREVEKTLLFCYLRTAGVVKIVIIDINDRKYSGTQYFKIIGSNYFSVMQPKYYLYKCTL
jgi:hypothetical protein